MKISFNQIWEKVIMPLEGRTVYTLDEQKPNNVLEVTNEHLIRDSQNESPEQRVPRYIFEAVYTYILEKGEITRAHIDKTFPHRYSSIVCAVLAKAPNIGYDLKPIRLFKK